jgi:hypothetical protein
MAKYVVGQLGHKYESDQTRDGPRIKELEEVAMLKGLPGCSGPGTPIYVDLVDAEKEAARMSHGNGFVEFVIFQLVETVKAAEPLETADIKKE